MPEPRNPKESHRCPMCKDHCPVCKNFLGDGPHVMTTAGTAHAACVESPEAMAAAMRVMVSRAALDWLFEHVGGDLTPEHCDALRSALNETRGSAPKVNVRRVALAALLSWDDNAASDDPMHYMARRALDAAMAGV